MSSSRILRVALCQLKPGADKAANLARAAEQIERAANGGAKLVCLPEVSRQKLLFGGFFSNNFYT
jgi:predicted amidohydrolase